MVCPHADRYILVGVQAGLAHLEIPAGSLRTTIFKKRNSPFVLRGQVSQSIDRLPQDQKLIPGKGRRQDTEDRFVHLEALVGSFEFVK